MQLTNFIKLMVAFKVQVHNIIETVLENYSISSYIAKTLTC